MFNYNPLQMWEIRTFLIFKFAWLFKFSTHSKINNSSSSKNKPLSKKSFFLTRDPPELFDADPNEMPPHKLYFTPVPKRYYCILFFQHGPTFIQYSALPHTKIQKIGNFKKLLKVYSVIFFLDSRVNIVSSFIEE